MICKRCQEMNFPLDGLCHHVEDYGGIPDGFTDCTDAVQKAFNDAAGDGGRVIFNKGNTYLYNPVKERE